MTFSTVTHNGVTFQASPIRPSRRDDKKYERTVRYKGRERVVHWGQPGEQMERDHPDARANFNARHRCETATDPFSARLHACVAWRPSTVLPGSKAPAVTVVRNRAGKRGMFLVASNAYRDRELDIVMEAALKQYVATFTGNALKFWHTGHPIGRIVTAEMVGPFLVETAEEGDNRVIITRTADGAGTRVTTVKAVWDEIEAASDVYNAASIGFQYRMGDKGEDRAFRRIYKHETSVLPHDAAANAYTYVEVTRE